jgi:predicted nucleotidyltransferase
MAIHVDISKDDIAAFCRRNRIRSLAFFGSVLRADFGPENDVDGGMSLNLWRKSMWCDAKEMLEWLKRQL